LVLPVFVLRRALGRARRFDFLLVFSSLFGLLLAGIKGYMIFSVFAGAYVLSVARPEKFKIKHLAAGMAAVLAFFVVYAAKIDIWSRESYVGTGLLKIFPALKMPYLYFSGSWPAASFVIDGTVPDLPRTGTFVFQPLWKFLGALGFIDYTPVSQPFINFGQFTFNVYSLVGEVFWDVKWPGVLVVTFLLGLINTRLYLRVFGSDFWGHVIVYAVFVHGLFISFFSFTYTFNVYFLLGYVYLLGFVLPCHGVLVKSNGNDDRNREVV
jgi:oligosaccharide repeat unit polymerase